MDITLKRIQFLRCCLILRNVILYIIYIYFINIKPYLIYMHMNFIYVNSETPYQDIQIYCSEILAIIIQLTVTIINTATFALLV